MRLSLEQMGLLEELSPLTKEVGAKTRWRRMTDGELQERLERLHALIGELLRSLEVRSEDERAEPGWIPRDPPGDRGR